MDMCLDVQEDTEELFKGVNHQILEQKLRVAEFRTTMGIVQDLDGNKPEAFPLLYQFKKDDINAQINSTKEVAEYYKSGKNDPSHIAGLEKMQKQTLQKKKRAKFELKN